MVTTEMIQRYQRSKEVLDNAKALEMMLRVEICSIIHKGKEVGTHNLVVGDYKLKAVKKHNIKIDKDILEDIIEDMNEDEAECFKYTPRIMKKNYDALVESGDSDLVDKCIEVTDSAPSLEIDYNI